MSQLYAIRDIDQARRYLADPILGNRLRCDVRLMLSHKGKSASEILGSPDDSKFRSCLTLFFEAASDKTDRTLFTEALDRFYAGAPRPSHVGTPGFCSETNLEPLASNELERGGYCESVGCAK